MPSPLPPYPWRQQCVCFLPLALLLPGIVCVAGTGDEVTLYFLGVRERNPGLTQVMEWLSDWVITLFYGGYLIFFVQGLVRRDFRQARFVLLFAVVQFCVAILAVQFIKTAVGRPRPLMALAGTGYAPWVLDVETHSFPSGHATEIAGAAFLPAIMIRRYAFSFCMGAMVALIGFSRIYLSRHHLSDVAAGALAGAGTSLLTYYLFSRESA